MNAPCEITAAPSPLFPTRGEQSVLEDALAAALARSAERVAAGPVAAASELTRFRATLAGFDFEAPRPLGEVLDWTVESLERGIVHVTHPLYFGLFNPAPTFASICADRISSVFNPQLASSRTSPVPVDIEAHVIRAIASRAGLPLQTAGHFTSGGSEANYTALLCALTAAEPTFARLGSRAFAGRPVFYVSEDAHLAWYKIAHQAGVGRDALRAVACDATGRMNLHALASRIEEDQSDGCVPVMIVATAGTTNAGMIDPLAECVEIARRLGVWLHVDAAWGGAAVVSERLRPLLAGSEAADSMTVDAHKWLATTMGCGMFLTARPEVLSETFHVSATFMPSSVAHLDPYINSAQWSRRFLGLRLFLSLATAGWRGYADHVERCVDLAGLLERSLRARGWRIANASTMAVVLAEPPAGYKEADALASAVVASGDAWVSSLEFRGTRVLRCCITNGRTTQHQVLELVDLLESLGQTPSIPNLTREQVTMDVIERLRFQEVVDDICALGWSTLTADDMIAAAWAYYYFSIQFRESLQVARRLYPHDPKLAQLEAEECNTDNLSPWPGVVKTGEKVNHDEFMRRTLTLLPLDADRVANFEAIGEAYLADTRALDDATRAASIASYEDGGLERVFTSMLTFSDWSNPMLRAFSHFLSEHVRFDSDPEQGHGALSRHIRPDDRILPLWEGFRGLFERCVPAFNA